MTKILVITPYAPARDGIAAYALQTVARLRATGHDVEVLSPYPSAAHHHLDLPGLAGAMALKNYTARVDKVIVQYHPDFFFRPEWRTQQREAVALALARAWRAAPDVEILVHEADYSRSHAAVAWLATRAMWASATRVIVHTDTERAAFSKAFGVPLRRIRTQQHGGDFAPHTTLTRAAARERLGLPAGEFAFLSIGFIQPHKGFDRALRAFGTLNPAARGARFDLVGSVRVSEPAYVAYADELFRLANSTPRAHVHSRFVSDEEFDVWIVAADVVVLPYLHIWSSSVFERAALFQRAVIATRVGGLSEQARPNTVLVDDDEALARAMDEALVARNGHLGAGKPAVPWPSPTKATRENVTRALRARAGTDQPAPAATPPTVSAPGRNGASAAAPPSSAPVRRLPPLQLPSAESRRPLSKAVKRVVQRLTRWQLEPVVRRINELQQATIASIDSSRGDSGER